jgi:hypothetical protein
VLDLIARSFEAEIPAGAAPSCSPTTAASICIGAAPSLPPDTSRGGRLAIAPDTASSGAAAALRQRVVVSNVFDTRTGSIS